MAFHFSLATVLHVRGILEEREERLLQGILFEISQSHENLARTEAEIAGSDVSRRESVFKMSVGHSLHATYGEIQELKQCKQALAEHIGKLEQLRDKQIVVYEQARRNREMLTDIQNHQRKAYESGTGRREQRILDDNYIARRGRC